MVAGGRGLKPHTGEKGGSATGPSPVDRARNGSKHHLLVDATGLPLAWTLTGGNRNDVTQLIPLVDRVPAVGGRAGRPRRRPERVTVDSGYDHDKYRRLLRQRGTKPEIARRKTTHGSGSAALAGSSSAPSPGCTTSKRLLVRYDTTAAPKSTRHSSRSAAALSATNASTAHCDSSSKREAALDNASRAVAPSTVLSRVRVPESRYGRPRFAIAVAIATAVVAAGLSAAYARAPQPDQSAAHATKLTASEVCHLIPKTRASAVLGVSVTESLPYTFTPLTVACDWDSPALRANDAKYLSNHPAALELGYEDNADGVRLACKDTAQYGTSAGVPQTFAPPGGCLLRMPSQPLTGFVAVGLTHGNVSVTVIAQTPRVTAGDVATLWRSAVARL